MAKEYIMYEDYLSRARKQAQEEQSLYAAERQNSFSTHRWYPRQVPLSQIHA